MYSVQQRNHSSVNFEPLELRRLMHAAHGSSPTFSWKPAKRIVTATPTALCQNSHFLYLIIGVPYYSVLFSELLRIHDRLTVTSCEIVHVSVAVFCWRAVMLRLQAYKNAAYRCVDPFHCESRWHTTFALKLPRITRTLVLLDCPGLKGYSMTPTGFSGGAGERREACQDPLR